jgi:hypothetical protein
MPKNSKTKIRNFAERIIPSITGWKEQHWRDKLVEIEELGLERVALFLEIFDYRQRIKIYAALEDSGIKEIPLIHIKEGMSKAELVYLKKRYKNPYFTVHEEYFAHQERWRGFEGELYLELNFDNQLIKEVEVEKIGGFCLDLSHFKAAEEGWTKEFEYVLTKRDWRELFVCNHLNGYDYSEVRDKHWVENWRDFEYLASLPEFVFGEVIAIEVFNSIKEQLEFRDYLVPKLNQQFKIDE